MKKINRREFIKLAGAASLALGISACATDTTPSDTDTPASNGGSSDGGASTNVPAGQSGISGEEVVISTEFVDYFDFMEESIVDTSRKSTLNSDERLPKLTVTTTNEITTWEPSQDGRGRSSLILTVFEPLFYYHDNYELEPCLAKSYEEVDDLTFKVEIYDYIKDTDGNDITAEDVVACIQVILDKGTASDYFYIDNMEIVDDYNITFHWTEKVDSFTALASIMETAIYSRKAREDHDFNTDPVGTGAYYLSKLVTGSEYELKPNEDYWQQDVSLRCIEAHQNVDTLIMKVIPDSSVAYINFEAGEIDAIALTSDHLDDFKEGGKHGGEYTVSYERASGRMGLSFNQAGPSIMNDENMRFAIAYMINGQDIVEALSPDFYYVCHGEAGSSCSGYNPEWDTYENYYSVQDLALAKEYLEAANYDGSEIVLLIQSGSNNDTLCVQILKNLFEANGISSCRLDIYDFAIISTYLYDLTAWDLWFFNWNGDPISQQWGRQFDVRNYSHGACDAGINDEHLQEMIEKVQLKSQCTQELIDEIQAYITEHCMNYSLYGSVTYNAFNKFFARIVNNHAHKDISYGACDFYLDT